MSGGDRYEYLWQDSDQYKKPTAVSAPLYIELLMNWIEKTLDDETTFPSTVGTIQLQCPQIIILVV
jgi:MOB kinase activator 1